MTERPQTPAEKGQRMNMNPALLTKLFIRRNRYENDGSEGNGESEENA